MQKIKSLLLLVVEVAVISVVLHYLREALVASDNHEISVVMTMLIDIAFLAVYASFGGRLAKLLGFAPMAGKIIMGIVAGPAVLGVIEPYAEGVELARLAGVLFILFEAGLHFDMELLKKNWFVSTAIACTGVLIPLVTIAVALANNALDEITSAAALLGVILVTILGAIFFEKAVQKETGVKMAKPTEAI